MNFLKNISLAKISFWLGLIFIVWNYLEMFLFSLNMPDWIFIFLSPLFIVTSFMYYLIGPIVILLSISSLIFALFPNEIGRLNKKDKKYAFIGLAFGIFLIANIKGTGWMGW